MTIFSECFTHKIYTYFVYRNKLTFSLVDSVKLLTHVILREMYVPLKFRPN